MYYTFRTVQLRSPKRIKMKVIPVLQTGYEALSNFIATEVESFAGDVRAFLDGDMNSFSGNRYDIARTESDVTITDSFGEEATCKVSMAEFEELLQSWVDETERVQREDREENKLVKILWDMKETYPIIKKAQYGGLTADHSEVLECLLLVENEETLREIELNGRAEEMRKYLSDSLRRSGWEKGSYKVSLSYELALVER
ncbi:MAG: hypothetical protein IJ091_01890 [Oscillospiraceae bacterium]|nr:hypothetical protein [Oscillospiraceae bacterium]